MTGFASIPPAVRRAVVQWPSDAPRGAVTVFCSENRISRKTFYSIRRRVTDEGPDAAMQPHPRRPRTSPTKTSDTVINQALHSRSTLAAAGRDHGPISVITHMRAAGLTPPSRATIARIFSAAGVVSVAPLNAPPLAAVVPTTAPTMTVETADPPSP